MEKYRILDLLDTEKAIPLMLEYGKWKMENEDVELSDLQSIMSYLKLDRIYASGDNRVLPYFIDGEWFVCACDEKDQEAIPEAINFIDSHENMKGLHILEPKEEMTGNYLKVQRIVVDGNIWVE